jgi:putative metalloenzyme radical SAM/SPASM domain maturase
MCPRHATAGCEDGDLEEGSFEALSPAFPHLESLVLNGIGEPLLHPGLEGFIRRARSAMPGTGSIGFQTNGHLMDASRASSLIAAGLDRACVSVDALDAALFGDIRTGGSLAAAEAAIGALAGARSGLGASGFSIGIEFVVMRKNLEELPQVLRWAAARGADFAIVSQLFPYAPDAMDLAAWDANLDVAVEIREKYAALGRRRGLELDRYQDVFMHYAKTPAEEALVGLVGEMQAEASQRGVTLNVGRLLALDPDMYRRGRAVFAEAAAVASAEGLELALPELMPRSSRSCEFVEGGSAFVSRAGEVHPCYFLWHRYSCHAGGWEKKVAPRSFGSLAGRDILSIWNDADFQAFRVSVLDYDYPFCLNCNLALCDYVQLEDFEQDCHINREPCAVCLWCMGLFRCMS